MPKKSLLKTSDETKQPQLHRAIWKSRHWHLGIGIGIIIDIGICKNFIFVLRIFFFFLKTRILMPSKHQYSFLFLDIFADLLFLS